MCSKMSSTARFKKTIVAALVPIIHQTKTKPKWKTSEKPASQKIFKEQTSNEKR